MFTLQSSRPFAQLRDKLPQRKTLSISDCFMRVPEDSNTLQVLDILKMSVFGLQSKTVLSSKITCFVTVAVGAVVPLYLGLSALERDLGVQSSLLA